MNFRWNDSKNNERESSNDKNIFPLTIEELRKILVSKFENNPDLKFSSYKNNGKELAVFYIDYQVDLNKIDSSLLQPLLDINEKWTNQSVINNIPVLSASKTDSLELILENLIIGGVYIYVEGENKAVSYQLQNKETRSLDEAETESVVIGPKVGFTESLATNMNIIRSRIKSTDLVLEEIKIGKTIPADVRLVYLKSVANEDDVNTMRQRLLDLDVDEIEDTMLLKQYIEDDQTSPFPQYDITERPDRFSYAITRGRVGVLVENSPTGFTGPINLFTFLESPEDLYMRWESGTFLRMLRIFASFLSIILTPIYVAVVTYQYSVIPMQLLISIGQSRAAVPFPPFLEALILEFLLELLREAGARLPTKVGQTMGVVGGIVIGQAAVQAGITSSILIIVVAVSALASFTTPSYLLGTAIRLIRFPLIILAAAFGLFGLMFGLCFIAIHLLRVTSLGRPYLSPLYPLQWRDFNKVFFRSPPRFDSRRTKSYRPKLSFRFSKEEASRKRDIDE